MARTLFFRMVLRKSSEITNKKRIFSHHYIFYDYEYFFFSLRFDFFLIIAKGVNQIMNNLVWVVARLAFLFSWALNTGCCNAFQHIFVN